MDFPCAANSCIVFTVLLLIMAASCAHDEPHAPQLTAISGVGQFYLGVSLVNYTSALIHLYCFEYILAVGNLSFQASYCFSVTLRSCTHPSAQGTHTERSMYYVNRRQQGSHASFLRGGGQQ